jgi:hypothetical protein
MTGVEEQGGDGHDCRRNDDPDSLGGRARPRRQQQRRPRATQGEPYARPPAGYSIEFRKHRFPPIPPLFRQRSARERENPEGNVAAAHPFDEEHATRRPERDDRDDHTHRAHEHRDDHGGSKTYPHQAETHAQGTLGSCVGRRGIARLATGSSVANAVPAVVRR